METTWVVEVEGASGTVAGFADVPEASVILMFAQVLAAGGIEIPRSPWQRNVLALCSPHTRWIRARPAPIVGNTLVTGTVATIDSVSVSGTAGYFGPAGTLE